MPHPPPLRHRILQAAATLLGVPAAINPLRPYNVGSHRPGPVGRNLNSIFFTATKGTPRYEDLITPRLLELTHTVAIPTDAITQQVTTTPFAVVPSVEKPTSRHQTACDDAMAFFEGSMNGNGLLFDGLCKQWLADLLSIDAGILELVPDETGILHEIYPRDGATFTKNIDQFGRLPGPGTDEAAYYQVGTQFGFATTSTLLTYNAEGLPGKDVLLQNAAAGVPALVGYQAISPIPFSRDQIVWAEENPKPWRLYGYGRVQKVQRLVETIINQDISNLKIFSANEIPDGVLNLGETYEDEIKRFREYWREEIEGQQHKLPILGAKSLQWIPFRPSLQDLQFLDGQHWYHKLVWFTFGLNQNEVGDLADVNRSTAQEQAETVWRRTTVPLLELLASLINTRILPFLEAYRDIGGEIEFVWDPKNPIIERQKRLEQREDLRLHITTPNRILLDRGDETVPWGDMPIAVFESLARTQPEYICREILGMKNPPEPLFGAGLLGLAAPTDAAIAKAVADMKAGRSDDEPSEWKGRIEALTRQVGGVIRDELEKLKPAIETAFPVERPEGGARVAVNVDPIVDGIHVADLLQAVAAPARGEAMQAAVDREAARLGDVLGRKLGKGWTVRVKSDFDVTQTFAYRRLQQVGAQLMISVEQAVKDRIRSVLLEVIGQGGNVNDAWRALSGTIDDLSADHARLVARTEILGAARHGTQALAESARDLIGGKSWHSRKIAGRTRPWHAVMDGVTVGTDESFTVPQIGAKGQPRDYPRTAFVVGEDQPYNCMCDQRCVLKDDLPESPESLRAIRSVSVLTDRQAEVLAAHGKKGETLRSLLERTDSTASRRGTCAALGISSATLYEWRQQEGLE